MSERFGACKPCRGIGEVMTSDQDGVTGEKTYYKVPCLSCDGTGQSGNALHYVAKEQEKDVALNN